MRKITYSLIFILVLGAMVYGFFYFFRLSKKVELSPAVMPLKPIPVSSFAKFIGETVVYDVIYKRVRIGRATLACLPDVLLGSVLVSHVSFKTQVMRFQDLENIYCDLKTMLPLRIERDIQQLFAKERIVEEYNQSAYAVKITKTKGSRSEVLEFKNDGPIHNPIIFPYSVRLNPDLEVGWKDAIRLATRSYTIKLVAIESVSVPAGNYQAYHFASEPRSFDIWISADQNSVPIKMRGDGMFGYTLLMRKYSQRSP